MLPGGASFTGPEQLKQVVRSQADLFTHNLTEKMLTYALGRGLERSDREAVHRIEQRLAASGYRFSALVLEIVNSEAFQKQGRMDDRQIAQP